MFMHRFLGIADRKALAYGTHDRPYASWQKTHTNPSVDGLFCLIQRRKGKIWPVVFLHKKGMVWYGVGCVGESGLNDQSIGTVWSWSWLMPSFQQGGSTGHWTCLCFASPGRLLSCCGCSPDGRQLPSTLRGAAQTWWFQSFYRLKNSEVMQCLAYCARAPSMIRYDRAWLNVWFSMGCANALSQSVNECTVTSLERTVGA